MNKEEAMKKRLEALEKRQEHIKELKDKKLGKNKNPNFEEDKNKFIFSVVLIKVIVLIGGLVALYLAWKYFL